MTATELESVRSALAELVGDWNQAADRGATNQSIALVVYDDGSGYIATQTGPLRQQQRIHDFDDAAELLAFFSSEGVIQ